MEKLPLVEPDIKYSLTNQECLCILANMALPIESWELYGMFIYPKGGKTKVFLQTESKQFFNSHAVQAYIQAVENEMNPTKKVKQKTITPEELELKIKNSSIILKDALCDKISDINDPNFLDIAKIFLKEFFEESKQEVVVPPLRILSENCSNCRYKKAIEENFVDECVRCQYQLNSEIKYSHKDMLVDTQINK